jgi:putative membrane protein
MTTEDFFPPSEKERLVAALREAERKTSGEIVPYIVGRSDAYPEAPWRAGVLGGALVLFFFSFLDITSMAWMPITIANIGLFTVAGFMFGAGIVFLLPSLRLVFVPQRSLELRVRARAQTAFVAEKIFLTRERTGILIFLSLLERRVIVLADDGISSKVAQEAWDEIVRIILDGIKQKRPAEGLLRAIEACGTLLQSSEVTRRSDDTNELSDSIQINES